MKDYEREIILPLKSRVYFSLHQEDFFNDQKSLEIYNKLVGINSRLNDNFYTYLYYINITKRVDLVVKEFLKKNEDCIIVYLGCGLDSLFFRNDNGKALFFNIDKEEVMEVRKKFYEDNSRVYNIASDIFSLDWMREVMDKNLPVLIVCTHLFGDYKEGKVIRFLNELTKLKRADLIFEAYNKKGLSLVNKALRKKKYRELVFCIDDTISFVNELNCHTSLITVETVFSNLNEKESFFDYKTKIMIKLVEKFRLAKLIRLSIK